MTQPPPKATLLRQVAASRGKWGPKPHDVVREPVGPGEESVWDYPRPPVIRAADNAIRIEFAGIVIAQSTRAVRVLETAGAPVYYLPPSDVDLARLEETDGYSVCEWKGAAIYYDVVAADRRAGEAAFSYLDPFDDLDEGYAAIAGWIGFYPGRVDGCFVGEEKARPQPGGLYAGWITTKIKGPIKGGPGTAHW